MFLALRSAPRSPTAVRCDSWIEFPGTCPSAREARLGPCRAIFIRACGAEELASRALLLSDAIDAAAEITKHLRSIPSGYGLFLALRFVQLFPHLDNTPAQVFGDPHVRCFRVFGR
jgi:hypothetical protein